MPTAYGYCRVSHEDSTASGLGIAAQVHAITTWWEYARANYPQHQWSTIGWKGEKDVGEDTTDGLFIDQSVSAFKFRLVKRPAGARLAALLQPGDLVVFARLDRGFRGVADFAVTVEKWIRQGVLIQFINPAVDLTSAYGMAFAQVAAVFAQLESALKSERLKEAQARGRENGQKMGRHVSFGWKLAPNGEGCIPNEEERQEIAAIAFCHDMGQSFNKIANTLNSGRVLADRKWTPTRCCKAYKAAKKGRVPAPQGVTA